MNGRLRHVARQTMKQRPHLGNAMSALKIDVANSVVEQVRRKPVKLTENELTGGRNTLCNERVKY